MKGEKHLKLESEIKILQANVKELQSQLGSAHKRIPSGGWSGICIVADTKQCSIPIKTKLGVVMLSQTEVEILSKIGFLLYPDMNDTVFTGQLTLKEREICKNKNKEVSK